MESLVDEFMYEVLDDENGRQMFTGTWDEVEAFVDNLCDDPDVISNTYVVIKRII